MALAARAAHPDQRALVLLLQEELGEGQHSIRIVQPVGGCKELAVGLLDMQGELFRHAN